MSKWDAKTCPYFEHFILEGGRGPVICHHPDPKYGYTKLIHPAERARKLRQRFGTEYKVCNHGESTSMLGHYSCPMKGEKFRQLGLAEAV